MRKNNRLIPLFFILIAVIALWQIAQTDNKTEMSSDEKPRDIHQIKFFDERLFYKSLAKINTVAKPDKEIKGGIVPHHLLATEIISEFYAHFKNQKIETVIILGPNHKEAGDFPALSSAYDWNTPSGRVLVDEAIVNDLARQNLIRINEDVLEDEHSVALHPPFIKHFLPKAKIVPIIISGKMKIEDVEKLSAALTKYARKKGTVIIASVDFSHYLPENIAADKDKESFEAIKNFDFEKIYNFTNDNLDSPQSIIILLSALKQAGANNPNLIKNLNSEQISKSGSRQTTSYFTILFD